MEIITITTLNFHISRVATNVSFSSKSKNAHLYYRKNLKLQITFKHWKTLPNLRVSNNMLEFK